MRESGAASEGGKAGDGRAVRRARDEEKGRGKSGSGGGEREREEGKESEGAQKAGRGAEAGTGSSSARGPTGRPDSGFLGGRPGRKLKINKQQKQNLFF